MRELKRKSLLVGCFLCAACFLDGGRPVFAGTPAEQASASSGADSRNLPLEELLGRMEGTYQKIRTYRARFDQETETKSIQRTKRSSGEIYIQKPDKVRWSYREPEAQEIYMLPGRVYVWLPGRNQVMETSEQDFPGMAQVRLLLAQGRLSDSFTVTLLPPEAGQESYYRLRLIPKSETRLSLVEMILSVRKQDFLLARTESQDLLHNVTKIFFHDWEINVPFDDGLFRFEPPEGAEVLGDSL
ncbi:MAG: outer-membrane lipoprotein carrier protein LolA [bacterium]